MNELKLPIRMMSDPDVISYTLDAMMGLRAVRDGEKPLLIVSEGKSVVAYELAAEIADEDPELTWIPQMLTCEDGELHEHAFVCRKGAPYAEEACDLIADEHLSREVLQVRLGHLLGYSAREIRDFRESAIAQTCVCDCCGGEPGSRPPRGWGRTEFDEAEGIAVHEGPVEHVTLASKVDPNPGRFTPNAARY